MSIKKIIIKIIGLDKVLYFYSRYNFIRDFFYRLIRNQKKIYSNIVDNEIDNIRIYSIPNSHCFFGYYDLDQINTKENKLLAHVVPRNAETQTTISKIGYFDIETGEFHHIAETSAWCWQQGSRLRWNPKNENQIVFNNISEGKFVTQVWDIEKKACIKEIYPALYDFDRSFSYGLSLNFARLQRLRPGYGYNTLDDLTINDNAPKDDGIFLVDLISQDSHLIIKLRDLALKVDPDFKFPHYINHISISPDGKHFIFFHVWQLENEYHWKTRLYVSDIKGKELKLLESKHKVSHYTWKNNEEILITCYDNKIQYYAIYNIHTKEKKIVNIESLNLDGHPTFFKNKELIISDTYPKKYNYQTLYIHNLKKNENRELLRLYSDPRMYGEKRCDLHPRLSPSEKYIICDSTFESGLRKIILIKNENN